MHKQRRCKQEGVWWGSKVWQKAEELREHSFRYRTWSISPKRGQFNDLPEEKQLCLLWKLDETEHTLVLFLFIQRLMFQGLIHLFIRKMSTATHFLRSRKACVSRSESLVYDRFSSQCSFLCTATSYVRRHVVFWQVLLHCCSGTFGVLKAFLVCRWRQ